MTFVNRVFNHSCETMSEIPDGSVHCVVTSPPYDDARDYGGHADYDRSAVISELQRVVAPGGVVCWVVQDRTKDFAKTGTSFRTAVDFISQGFRLFETVIYRRDGSPGGWWNQRLRVDHEYIHVFFKGERPRAFHKPMIRAVSAGAIWDHASGRKESGDMRQDFSGTIQSETKCRGTVWDYGMVSNRADTGHPATFPDALASDLIQAFSDEGDIVLDPFMGSGTTAVMAEVLRRRWTGYEINPTYYDLILRRTAQRSLFNDGAA